MIGVSLFHHGDRWATNTDDCLVKIKKHMVPTAPLTSLRVAVSSSDMTGAVL